MKKEAEDLIELRSFAPTDESFIYATWLAGFYYGNAGLQKLIEKVSYFNKYRRLVAYILAKPTISIRVAALKADTDTICAYVILDSHPTGRVLHWAYCKPSFRRLGLVHDLIPPDIIATTHMTESVKDLKPKQWDFNPYLI